MWFRLIEDALYLIDKRLVVGGSTKQGCLDKERSSNLGDFRDFECILVLEGEDGSLSVNYLEMIPLVIRSIQELKQEIDELAE